MRDSRARGVAAWAVAAAVALATVGMATVGMALAQERGRVPEPEPKGVRVRGKAPARKGGPGLPGAPPRGVMRKDAGDPLAGPAGRGEGPAWPFHYKFKLSGPDGSPMNASYYPSRAGVNASTAATATPVVLLVHEKGGFAKDFQDPIDDLKGQGLADALQAQGYAVLLVDFRGPIGPARERAEPAPGRERKAEKAEKAAPVAPTIGWRGRLDDLQAAYQFLVDRHNRGELNLAKLGVVGVGEGGTMAARWALAPGAATSSEGRISDVGALAIISPVAADATRFEATLAQLAPRVPLLLMAGDRDATSKGPFKAARAVVERPAQRLSKVATFPTALHGARLLRFTPQVPAALIKFLDKAIRYSRNEWEPRYNLTPIAYTEPVVVLPRDRRPGARLKDKEEPAPAPKADRPVRKGAAR